MRFKILFLSCILGFSLTSFAQKNKNIIKDNFTGELSIRIDTFIFNSHDYTFEFQKEKYLFFKSQSNQDLCEITLFPSPDTLVESIQLLKSNDFQIIDSLRFYSENYFRAKIRFSDLDNAKYLGLVFKVKLKNGNTVNQEYKLFPYRDTYIAYDNEPIDLFLEEEKVIEMPCFNVYNIKMDNDFQEYPDFEIKISQAVNTLRIKVRPKVLGAKTLTLKLKTLRPFVNQQDQLSFDLAPIKIRFNVKPNRVDYINPEKSTIFFNPNFKASEDIQFDFNRNMGMQKTYRIEDQQENGGNLIAEIFTQSQLGNNNKVLCKIRTFALHRINEGYLYVKDGDKTRFLTNFNIIEKPRIDDISIMHEGEDWTNNLSVFPGEKFEVRVKGTGLQQSSLQFEGIENLERDTTRLSDEVAFYIVNLPMNFPKKKVNVFMNKRSTEYSLLIKDYQLAADFDYVIVNYDGINNIAANSEAFNKPVFYEGNIKDINIVFDPSKIDEPNKLYGKQYIDIEVLIYNSRNDLLEVQYINNLAICPNETSPRGAFYDRSDVKMQPISLNDYLWHKTYTLDPFTQIYINIKHNTLRHGVNTGYTRKIKLIKKRKYNLDVQVSFPAGLLTYKFGQSKEQTVIDNFTGISIAFIAQLEFYDGENVNKFKPYSIGAGFIAIDAFNFNQGNTSRDSG